MASRYQVTFYRDRAEAKRMQAWFKDRGIILAVEQIPADSTFFAGQWSVEAEGEEDYGRAEMLMEDVGEMVNVLTNEITRHAPWNVKVEYLK